MSKSQSSNALETPIVEVGRLRRRSTIALLVLLLSASIGHLISWELLRRSEDDSRVINVAGRQRMLSQKLAKSLLAANAEADESVKAVHLGESRITGDDWSAAHRALRDGSEIYRLPIEQDPAFRSSLDRLRELLDPILVLADRQVERRLTADEIAELADLESRFLKAMDAYVERLEGRAKNRMADVSGLETGFYLLSLGALLAQALLVLRPAMHRLERSIRQRDQSLAIRDLAESERSAVLEAVSDRAFTLDREGRATAVGSGASRRSHDLSRVLTADSYGRLVRAIERQLNGGGAPAALELVPRRRAAGHRFDARIAKLAPDLVVLVVRDISELHRSRAAVVDAIDAERDRLGKEIHDGVCQDLLGLLMELRSVARSGSSGSSEEMAGSIRNVLQAFEGILEDARALGRSQIAPRLQRAGSLAEALRSLARSSSAVDGPVIRVELPESAGEADPDEADHHLFRIAQEAVQNVLRHARAERIVLRLGAEGDSARLQIEDDGVGPPSEVATLAGVGLASMNLRAKLIGSELEVVAREGGGTRVAVVRG